MKLFLQCKDKFSESNALLRNMMGLLGNVAEVKDLRPQLMTTDFVSEFLMLVDSQADGIGKICLLENVRFLLIWFSSLFVSETSYNAAGVLAHMASDGADVWTIGNFQLFSNAIHFLH